MEGYKIITENSNQKNILIGDFIVKDIKQLKEIRDLLTKSKRVNYEIEEKEKIKIDDYIKKGCFKEGEKLIKRYDISPTYGLVEYKEKIYTSKNLNSILIFTSLIQELDPTEYDKIAQNFVKYGIFKTGRLENMWPICSENLLEQEKNGNTQDLEIFREVLKERIIEYEIQDSYSIEEFQEKNKLKELNIPAKQIITNTKVLKIEPRRIKN